MLRISKFLLLFSLLWVAIAHELELRPAPGHSTRRGAAPDENRYCSRETCGAEESSDTCRRRLSPKVLRAPNPSSHPVPGHWYDPANYGDSVDDFFRGEIARLAKDKAEIVTITDSEVSSLYIRFMDKPKSLAMYGLCGCIALIVLSRKAVWAAHVYEYPVLVNGFKYFHEEGLAILEKGERTWDMYYGLSDLSGNAFAPNEKPVAIVLAPRPSNSKFQYEPLMRELDRMVHRLIGVDPAWVGYRPNRDGDIESRMDSACANSKGKLLVQYEPSNDIWPGDSKAKARIWVEGTSWTWETSWPPYPEQKSY
ncbi:hypothetical protein CSHISOI_11141 [Colletotrichum shisoi]|uniref:Uncharacterized protein n=1 Tax=Colletotrichum shisoi TaxID=2078593 RepID=A0A5Q4BCJ0_9PEZI|nr:hypothetical protein CSHISOI_11141 [Colletotrichum shisoi]